MDSILKGIQCPFRGSLNISQPLEKLQIQPKQYNGPRKIIGLLPLSLSAAPMTNISATFGVELLWNKGIAALCDRRIPDEFPDRRTYTPMPSFAGAMASSKLPGNLIPNPQICSDIRD